MTIFLQYLPPLPPHYFFVLYKRTETNMKYHFSFCTFRRNMEAERPESRGSSQWSDSTFDNNVQIVEYGNVVDFNYIGNARDSDEEEADIDINNIDFLDVDGDVEVEANEGSGESEEPDSSSDWVIHHEDPEDPDGP